MDRSLHPGDLGWHSSVGPEQMAKDLRVWTLEGVPITMGMLDGSEVLRMAIHPALSHDNDVADRVAHDLNEPDSGLFTGAEAIIEARGTHALSEALKAAGWVDDEPWTPMALDLTGALDTARLDRSGLRIEHACPDAPNVWTSIHWSSFKGTPYDDGARSRFVQRWTRLMTGPFADRAHSLIGYGPNGTPVAVTTVWTAGDGRPGLAEPMGVHRDHHGKGYGVAITLAEAPRSLPRHRKLGATRSAPICARDSRPFDRRLV
ncbi:GNAT family N-acetyltransferase [Agrococcus sediminis]|uniref:GNAT family N-acetyltransferase n=1 Tax=Agrococcus sediminis TaxID=2599924 RepID=UPI003415EAAA